jgi:hypothetical protein
MPRGHLPCQKPKLRQTSLVLMFDIVVEILRRL